VNLAGRIALVTGSSRGIGRGCALELARAGCHVALNYWSTPAEDADATAADIHALGREALVVPADVSRRDECERLVAATLERFGRIDILVNNAGTSKRKPLLEQPVEEVEHVWGVNLWSVFHMSQLVARHLTARADPAADCNGKIVVISSVLAEVPMLTSLAYNTSKAGLNHMARTMAGELARYRINVNTIEPGWTDTPGERRFVSEDDIQREARTLPWGRLVGSDEIGHACAFLCSDQANSITGATLRVDGGYCLPWRRPAEA